MLQRGTDRQRQRSKFRLNKPKQRICPTSWCVSISVAPMLTPDRHVERRLCHEPVSLMSAWEQGSSKGLWDSGQRYITDSENVSEGQFQCINISIYIFFICFD